MRITRLKNTIYILFLMLFLTGIFTGCTKTQINLRDEVFCVNIGSTISSNPKEYVRASQNVLKEMRVDVSRVDANVMGEYRANVKYKDTVKEFTIKVTDLTQPVITLKKENFYFEQGSIINLSDVVQKVEDISECKYGFSDDLRIADQNKKMQKTISFSDVGAYNCEVIAKDCFDNYSVLDFVINVVEAENLPDSDEEIVNYRKYMNRNKGVTITDINTFPIEGVYYGVGNTLEEGTNRPNLAYYTLKYGKYKVDFIQPDSQYIWLTFNESTEVGNTEAILDTLKEKNISAVFFITLSYAENNPELIKRMIAEGHVLGNYTSNFANVPELSTNSLTIELDTLYNYIYETYGYKMYLFRTPSGYYSEQSLALAQQLGYRTVFWSFAYADWDVNNQPETEWALQNALDKVHGGAIYLFSGSSSTNKEMLERFIDGVIEKNLKFAVYQNN